MFEVPWHAFGTSPGDVVVVVLTAVGAYVAVVAATRVVGLRSLSKMSAFDFAMTVAIGSAIASVAVTEARLADGVIAIAALYLLQWTVSRLRRATPLQRVIDNRPLLLVRDGEVIEEHLAQARLTLDDIRSKLRENNVARWSDVRAVVLETTGDVSVIHGPTPLDDSLLEGVVLERSTR